MTKALTGWDSRNVLQHRINPDYGEEFGINLVYGWGPRINLDYDLGFSKAPPASHQPTLRFRILGYGVWGKGFEISGVEFRG